MSSNLKSKTKKAAFLILALVLFLVPASALAQTYSFSLDEETVDVFWNQDGTMSLLYEFVFTNDTFASPIDVLDVGMPNENFSLNNVSAEVDGNPVAEVSQSPYVTPGIAVDLGSHAIQPGATGRVRVFVEGIREVLYEADQGENYASAVFRNTYFDSDFVNGTTDLLVAFHLPPGVQPDEPRWFEAPPGFPDEPETSLDSEGRVTYAWQNPQASPSRAYEFGASFPSQYIPSDAVVQPGAEPAAGFGNLVSQVGSILPLCLCVSFFGVIIAVSLASNSRRKLQYLPPKISIEGHGIKRGLTAVEAAILMEQPLDKILTMILFGVIKKGAATVMQREPLQISASEPLPENLNDYEKDFLEAFKDTDRRARQQKLQNLMVDLVKGVSQKMKGFNLRETVAYYRSIIEQAWQQVAAADTPEVKSQKFDEVMDWTMLDRDYDRRTREVMTGPVFVPVWWPRYDPTYRRSGGIPVPTSTGTGGGGKAPGTGGLPQLPGSDFAASIVNGVQAFAAGTIGNLADFTGNVSRVTNPPPPPPKATSYRGGGGGGRSGGCACACACACAGCACACAGGGR